MKATKGEDFTEDPLAKRKEVRADEEISKLSMSLMKSIS